MISSEVWKTKTMPAGTAQMGSQWSPSSKTATICAPWDFTWGTPWHHFSVRTCPTSSQFRKLRLSKWKTEGLSDPVAREERMWRRWSSWNRISSSPIERPCTRKSSMRSSLVRQTWDGAPGTEKTFRCSGWGSSMCSLSWVGWAGWSSDGQDFSDVSSSPDPHSHGQLTVDSWRTALANWFRNCVCSCHTVEYVSTLRHNPRRKARKLRETAPHADRHWNVRKSWSNLTCSYPMAYTKSTMALIHAAERPDE